jgi:hypothetical protein
VGVAAAAGVGLHRQHIAARGIVQRVIEPRDHPNGVAERGMRRYILDAFAVDPDFATVAEALQVFLAGEWPGPSRAIAVRH